MDDTLSAAIQEAYASAPSEEVIHHTIELRHPGFDEPLRVVLGHSNLQATLEAGAPLNPGEEVEFTACGFNLELPEVNDRSQPELVITIDNVDRSIVRRIEQVIASATLVEVTFRLYLASDTSAPQNNPPLTMSVRHIEADVFRVTARCGFEDLSRRAFPRRFYSLEQFPGLA